MKICDWNIDECRVGQEERTYKGMSKHVPEGACTFRDDNWIPNDIEVTVNGRFPANLILTYDDNDYEEVCGGFPESADFHDSASRYFYCAKASRRDRDDGLENINNTPNSKTNISNAVPCPSCNTKRWESS